MTTTPSWAVAMGIGSSLIVSLAACDPAPGPQDPLAVVMSADDAVGAALAMTIPDGEPQIERVALVTLEQMRVALSTDKEQFHVEGGTVGGSDAVGHDVFAGDAFITGPVYLVEVSHLGMDWLDGTGNDMSQSAWTLVDGSTRYTFTLIFDAGAGVHVGQVFEPLPESMWQRAVQDPIVAIVRTMTPTPAPRQTPTLISVEVGTASERRESISNHGAGAVQSDMAQRDPMRTADMPVAVLDTVRVAPFVPRSRWTYRVTEVEDGAQWLRSTYTETVVGAAQIAEDIVEIEIESAMDPRTKQPVCGGEPWGSGSQWEAGRSRLYLTPYGVVTGLGLIDGDPSTGRFRDRMNALGTRESTWEWEEDDPVELLRFPLEEKELMNYWWHTDQRVDVEVPAGEFRDCLRIFEIASARSAWAHHFCEGVGFVRHEIHGSNSGGGVSCAFELEEFEIGR